MGIRDARLPQDEPAILGFINGLQDYEAAFEPDRRRDPDFAVEHWRELQHRCAEKHGVMLIALWCSRFLSCSTRANRGRYFHVGRSLSK